jgi:hypothetical protein
MIQDAGWYTALAAVALLAWPASARGDKTINVNVTEVPYQPVHGFLDVHLEIGPQPASTPSGESESGDHIGFGLGFMSARRTNFQLITDVTWRRLDLGELDQPGLDTKNVFELLLGGRLYPLRPTFALGDLVARITGSASGGLVLTSGAADLGIVVTAGLSFSFGDDPNGVKLELLYRPVGTSAEYYPDEDSADAEVVDIDPSFGVRVSFLFGP